MLDTLLFLLVVAPFIAGAGCYLIKVSPIRSLIVVGTGALLAVTSLSLLGTGSFAHSPEALFGVPVRSLIQLADFALLFVILYYGFKLRNRLIQAFSALQIVLLGTLEFFMVDHAAHFPTFYCDNLSLIMVLVISIVGSLICIYALPYMDKHEEHLKLAVSRKPRFFAFLILFLGAMNGLVLANDLSYLYFFFEITTFCSFMLIGHDDTEIARQNSERALLINAGGGLVFLIGMMLAYNNVHTMDIQAIIKAGPMAGAMLLPLALICVAAFTKAAQLPFQSWLLGAMVAPTPTSALLHSSTMVKAGVFLVLRFAPAFQGTELSNAIALCGAFTFVATAALAMSQSNAKRILAYSTISNLGLIIACAGINTPAAMTAASLLIIFHAVSKGLLFCCVGYIEQGIHSRDIEDMRGLSIRLPKVTAITITGLMTMMLPPFGVLLGKWMAIESATDHMMVVVMIAIGSALTVLIYTRWAGNLMNAPFGATPARENMGFFNTLSLYTMACGAVVLSLLAPVIYTKLVASGMATAPFVVSGGTLNSPVGAFGVYPLFLVLGAGLLYAWLQLRKERGTKLTTAYMCGLNEDDATVFRGPINLPVKLDASNYYLQGVFGEDRITQWLNIGAMLLLALVIGGVL